MKRLRCLVALLTVAATASALVGTSGAASKTASPEGSQAGVQMEWLGHMFFRFTSPNGVVVLTSPWVFNADSPVTLEDVGHADIILVPDSHGDDMGQAFEIAMETGATVVAPRLLGQRLVDQGLESANVVAAQPGVTTRHGIQIVSVPGLHDNSIREGGQGIDLGPALAYFITFENGFTVFFGGSSFPTLDMQLYAQMYRPQLALLTGQHGAVPLAYSARLLRADNSSLGTVIPTHIRVGAALVQQAADEIARLQVPVSLFSPGIGEVHRY